MEARLNDHENGNSEQTDENKSDEDTDVRNSASTSTLKSTLPSDFSEINVSTTPISRPMSLVPLINVDTTMISPLQDAMSIGANLSPLVCTDLYVVQYSLASGSLANSRLTETSFILIESISFVL